METREILSLGEGQKIEFKESFSKLDREFVAFSNSQGGTLLVGVRDNGEVIGTNVSNSVLSNIQSIARNCDPPIDVKITTDENLIRIDVPEGMQKPYQCRDGFFVRQGANTQKLRSKEISDLFLSYQVGAYEQARNNSALYPEDFTSESVQFIRERLRIPDFISDQKLFLEFRAIVQNKEKYSPTNLGVLFFTKVPKVHITGSYITCVRFRGEDRTSIQDRKDLTGPLPQQIDEAQAFLERYISVAYRITGAAQREEIYEYPLSALREAIVNAICHRDYVYQQSNIFISIFSDRIEIQNPGGLLPGLSLEDVEGMSIRRNPFIVDLLYRAKYVEKIGSGLTRIKSETKENGNPEPKFTVGNFFTVQFFPRIVEEELSDLSDRQQRIVIFLKGRKQPVSSSEIAIAVNVSTTTITRDLQKLKKSKLVEQIGTGKLSRYQYVR